MTSAPSFPLGDAAIAAFIDAGLAEDVGSGDITCEAVVPADATLRAVLSVREPAIICGMDLARAFFLKLDPGAIFTAKVSDGDAAGTGEVIAEISGKARALLTAERSALNCLQMLSGIATHTKRYVDKIAHTETKLLDTRKTIPGYRLLTKYATSCGGAQNHRIGLFDALMIKDNHIALAGGIEAAILAARNAGQTQIQAECDTLDQAHAAVEAGATSLLLDNMGPERLKKAVAAFGGKIPLEASGGVTLETITALAETGVDYVSVGGALTLSAPAIDIGMDYGAR